MTQKQYVLVAAVSKPDHDGDSVPILIPGCLVVVTPASQAFWRGAPVPRVHAGIGDFPDGATLLGVLKRPPVPAGSNFGEPLAVLTVVVQGAAELLEEQYTALNKAVPEDRWTTFCNRRVLLARKNRIVIQ